MPTPTPKWPPAMPTTSLDPRGSDGPTIPIKVRKPDPARPSACIVRIAGWAISWCGRDVPGDEFRFVDSAHAVRHYADVRGPGLRACPECVAAYRAQEAKEKTT